MTLEQMTSRLAILMAGRCAEEMVFGRDKVTSGTADDIEQATKLARTMVTRYGLSERLGTVAYGENEEEVFLGHSVTRTQNVSEETAETIAVEVRKLIDAARAQAESVLAAHRDRLEALAQALLQFETLSGDEIRNALEGRPPARGSEGEAAPESAPTRANGPIYPAA